MCFAHFHTLYIYIYTYTCVCVCTTSVEKYFKSILKLHLDLRMITILTIAFVQPFFISDFTLEYSIFNLNRTLIHQGWDSQDQS